MSGDQLLRQLQQRCDIKRITAIAHEGAPPADLDITFSRDSEFFVQAVLTGFSDGIGDLTAQGLDPAGVTQSVTLSFTGNQRRTALNQRFTSLFNVDTAGLTNESTVGSVQVTAVSRTGQPVEQFDIVHTNIPVRFSGLRKDERVAMTGGADDISGKCYFGTTPLITRRDKIVFRGRTYNIRAFSKHMDRNGLRSYITCHIAAEDQL